jgi:hypothetical protein
VDSRQACLGELTAPERRVLVLRAGVGPGAPLTRARVARRLDITVKRVAKLERAGLRRLRGLCTGASANRTTGATRELVSGDATTVAGASGAGMTGGGSDAGAGTSGGAAGGSSGGSGSAGGSGGGGHSGSHGGGSADGAGGGSAGGSRGGVEGVSSTHPPGGGFGLVIPLLLLALALGAWALTRVLRGRRGTAVAAGPEAESPPAPWRPRLRSTMQGPGWTERPPAGTGDGSSWSAGDEPPAPAPESSEEGWMAPRQPSRR